MSEELAGLAIAARGLSFLCRPAHSPTDTPVVGGSISYAPEFSEEWPKGLVCHNSFTGFRTSSTLSNVCSWDERLQAATVG